MKPIFNLGLISALSLAITQTSALAIDLNMSSYTHNLGDAVNVDFSINNLGNGTAPSVGAFDFDVSYDNSILDFQSIIFGNQLALSGSSSFQTSSEPSSDLINFVEVSTNSPQDLDTLQQENFILATLTFSTVGVGTSNIIPSLNALGDANGNTLAINSLNNGSVTIQNSSSTVPWEFSPSLGVMLIASWCGLQYLHRKFV